MHRKSNKSKPSQEKIIKNDNFIYSQIILDHCTSYRKLKIPNETLQIVEISVSQKIQKSTKKSSITLLQVISVKLDILITIKLCVNDVPETGAQTIYIIQCKVYSTEYCSQVKDQLRSLLPSSMKICRIIHENMQRNAKRYLCNQA